MSYSELKGLYHLRETIGSGKLGSNLAPIGKMPVLLSLTFCLWETPKRVLLQTVKTHFTNSEHPDEMLHNAAFHQGLHCYGKKNLHTKNSKTFENYNLTPLDVYNRLSQVYYIKPEGRIH